MNHLENKLREIVSRRSPRDLVLDTILLVLLILTASIPLIQGFESRLVNIILLAGIYIILALGLNIVVGYTGLLDLGYVMFFASGAVITSLLVMLTKTPAGWVLPVGTTDIPEGTHPFCFEGSIFLILLISGFICALLGVLRGIPTLRLGGDYYAIVTLGLAEIFWFFMYNEAWLTGGAFGIKLPSEFRPTLLGQKLDYYTPAFFYFVLVLVLLGIFVSYRLQNSRLGRAWAAIRLDETAARTCGVNVSRYKMIAFAISGFFGGVGGSLYALCIGTVAMRTLEVWQSILILCCVVFGGMGSIRGVVVGAAILSSLGEILREDFVRVPMSELFALLGGVGRDPVVTRFLIWGALLIIIMRFRPQGILPVRKEGRPLTEEEEQTMRKRKSEIFTSRPEARKDFQVMAAQEKEILILRDLSKHFGGLRAVDHVTLSVTEGTITSLIGPNGAGKTTVFNVVTGIIPATGGEVIFNRVGQTGIRITNMRADLIAKLGIARTFQNIRLFHDLPVLDNVKLGLHLSGRAGTWGAILRNRSTRDEERKITNSAIGYLDFVGLLHKANQTAGSLSYGEQRRLEIARALACNPALLLLDEPAAGMNPQETDDLIQLIRKIRNNGITVFLIEHAMRLVMEISDRIYVLDYGQKIAEGTPEEIRKNPRVIEAYLGVEQK